MCKNEVKDKIREQAVCELMGLCLKINGLGARSQEVTGDKPTVFVQYSGHVSAISIDIHSKGWCSGVYADKKYRVDLCEDDFWEKYLETMHGLLEVLEC